MFLVFSSLVISLQQPTTVYEITTRPYLYLLSQKLGKTCTLKDIPTSEFDSWKEKGFEWIWFMGVWQLGEYGRQHDLTDPGCISGYNENCPGWTSDDVIGSPYAIVQYSVNTVVGTIDDIKWIREELHKRGMKLMLDFVPNHSAFEAPELKSTPNFYIRAKPQTELDPNRFNADGIAYGREYESQSAWTDVAQYNYFDLDFRKHQIDVLKFIGSVADGARCDMAHCVMNDAFQRCWSEELAAWGYSKPSTEFWIEAIQAVKAVYPNFKFLAESYHDNEAALIGMGFDYAYDKIPYDSLTWNNPQGFIQNIRDRTADYKSHGCYFTENHDEKRAIRNFGDYRKANAAAALLLTLPGLRFFNQEQWNGPANKIDVHLRRANPEAPIPECVTFYNKLFKILQLDCMKLGEFTQLSIDGSTTIPAWKYSYGDEHILVTVNYNENQSGGYIQLPDAPEGSGIPVYELISGTTYYRDGTEMRTKGLFVLLDGYQIQIFRY